MPGVLGDFTWPSLQLAGTWSTETADSCSAGTCTGSHAGTCTGSQNWRTPPCMTSVFLLLPRRAQKRVITPLHGRLASLATRSQASFTFIPPGFSLWGGRFKKIRSPSESSVRLRFQRLVSLWWNWQVFQSGCNAVLPIKPIERILGIHPKTAPMQGEGRRSDTQLL